MEWMGEFEEHLAFCEVSALFTQLIDIVCFFLFSTFDWVKRAYTSTILTGQPRDLTTFSCVRNS